MPYRKTYRNAKQYTRRAYVPKTKALVTGNHNPSSVERLAKRRDAVGQIARALKPVTQEQPERKVFDTFVLSDDSSLTANEPFYSILSNIAGGVNKNQRSGDVVHAIDFYHKMLFSVNESNSRGCVMRYMIIVDKYGNGLIPPIDHILTVSDEPSLLYLSAHNKNFTDDYTILVDKTVTLDFNYANDPVSERQLYKKFYKKLDFTIRFNGPGADVTSTNNNSIWMIIISSKTSKIWNYTRINYTDS